MLPGQQLATDVKRYVPRLPDPAAETKLNENGYVLVFAPWHPKNFGGGWYYLHRIVVEYQVGRVLRSWETVHHLSEDKQDCTLKNLFACTRTEHDKVPTWPGRQHLT